MATTVRRKPKFDAKSTLLEHLMLKHQAKTIVSRSDALKARLKEAFDSLTGVYVNEKGSKFYDLPETIQVGGKSYSGMELRRSVPVTFNEEKAEALLAKKEKTDPGITEAAQSAYIDQDKISRLHQEERITDKELDSLFEEGESWAFWPVEGEVLD